jgi:prepilin-type N-terminal cleavage/methylation domain-containing protein
MMLPLRTTNRRRTQSAVILSVPGSREAGGRKDLGALSSHADALEYLSMTARATAASSRRVRHDHRRAFSLVELIVVVGIIAILIALLLPTLTVARDRAKQIKCAAQLRGLGQGFANYAVAFKGAYPNVSGWQIYGGDGTGDDGEGPGWVELIEPSFAKVSSGAYHCPAMGDEDPINYFLESRWLVLNGRFDPKTTDITCPQFALSGDATHTQIYLPPLGDNLAHEQPDCDKDSMRFKNLSFFGEEHGRNVHRNGNNVLFADYHVAPYRKYERSEMTYHPKRPGVDWHELTDERDQP